MSHFYEKLDSGEIILRDDVTTAPQARKDPQRCLSSVTTKLHVLPNDFLDIWRIKEAAKIARDDLDIPLDEIPKEVWGRRANPAGVMIHSSDFGTTVHNHLEDACNALKNGVDHNAPEGWEKYVDPFMLHLFANCIEVLECEFMVADHRTAGTIDLIVKGSDGLIELMDFKTRVGKAPGDIKTKAYDKDAAQMAVEAEIYMNDLSLSYLPRINSVLIDCITGETHVKKWTVKAQAKGLNMFNYCSDFYDAHYGL
tara:strand:+ start:545 stop:1306 length:762 start_codon:yes stop_codon:yes gene_type:complete